MRCCRTNRVEEKELKCNNQQERTKARVEERPLTKPTSYESTSHPSLLSFVSDLPARSCFLLVAFTVSWLLRLWGSQLKCILNISRKQVLVRAASCLQNLPSTVALPHLGHFPSHLQRAVRSFPTTTPHRCVLVIQELNIPIHLWSIK